MAQKLWEKSVQVNKDIERFTVGRDREMDLYLAKHDVLGSMAHITMLESIGLLTKEELVQLLAELRNIYASAEKGEFVIEEGVEDVHSQVELMLTRRLGDIGKKIHSGRSRNDQVLLDLKLFTRICNTSGAYSSVTSTSRSIWSEPPQLIEIYPVLSDWLRSCIPVYTKSLSLMIQITFCPISCSKSKGSQAARANIARK